MNMLLNFIIFILISIYLISNVQSVHGVALSNYNNNKFGIHLAQPTDEDIVRASNLVNSNGGAWGYVTLVIHEDDKNVEKWQNIFEKLRENRIIPIIRLATKPQGSNWERPDKEDIEEWLNFLNNLHWVVKNRYIILFNEPNHATEWGGGVDAKNFAEVVATFAAKLKESNKDYFIMMGGLDLSAPSQKPRYEDAEIFFREVVGEIGSDAFNQLFDGLSSHSYPNPEFSSSPQKVGRKSIVGYEWELSLLRGLGIKNLPVFITETGWNGDLISRFRIAEYFSYAYQNIWLPDDRVFAVTPFILNYQAEPFLKFSWIKKDLGDPYPEYVTVSNLSKKEGMPEIEDSGDFIFQIPEAIVEDSVHRFNIEISNTGQGIWSRENNYALITKTSDSVEHVIGEIGEIKPFHNKIIEAHIKTGSVSKNESLAIQLIRDGKVVLSSKKHNFEVVSVPDLSIKASLISFEDSINEVFEVQIFNSMEELVYRKKDIRLSQGVGVVENIGKVVLNDRYRIVLMKNGFLPRQVYVSFKKEGNVAFFEPMLPLDPSGDGALSVHDLVYLVKKPFSTPLPR